MFMSEDVDETWRFYKMKVANFSGGATKSLRTGLCPSQFFFVIQRGNFSLKMIPNGRIFSSFQHSTRGNSVKIIS